LNPNRSLPLVIRVTHALSGISRARTFGMAHDPIRIIRRDAHDLATDSVYG
jgi:hypothetical protein